MTVCCTLSASDIEFDFVSDNVPRTVPYFTLSNLFYQLRDINRF